MKTFLMVLCLVIGFCGCVNFSGVGALQRYSREQDAMERYAIQQKEAMNRLFKDIEDNTLCAGKTTKDEVIRRYGDPILIEEENNQQSLLYRDALEYFPDKKAYLIFDSDDMLIDIKVVSKNPDLTEN